MRPFTFLNRVTPFLLAAAAFGESPRTVVLVELFTSEGCSSCPPAVTLLQMLQEAQPIAGVQVIPLSEHVDYWNQLGWNDPFSSGLFTSRQQSYSIAIRGMDVYTPQMVVDGAVAFVGSDGSKAAQAIANAAKVPKAPIALTCGGNPLSLKIRMDAIGADADLLLAVTENGLQSNVAWGENRGRVMTHIGVARRMARVGRARNGQPFTGVAAVPIEKGWNREKLSAVVFAQDHTSLRILGVGQIAINACGAN